VTRSLAVLRRRGGKKIPPQLQRMDAEDLLTAIFPDQVACAENLGGGEREIPKHPLVDQTVRDCLEEAMDIDGLEKLLVSIENNERHLFACDVIEASPLSQEILNARPYAYLDDAPLEERRTRAVYQRRWLDPQTASDMGKLDQSAIDRVKDEVWPEPRNADELHDAIVAMGFVNALEGASWTEYFTELKSDRRAAVMTSDRGGPSLWVAAERLPQLGVIYRDAELHPPIVAPESVARTTWDAETALVEILRGRLEAVGPVTITQLMLSSGLTKLEVESGLLRLEAEGFVIRGKFTPGATETEWCARRLLARIHSYTLNRLRQEIEPVASSDFIRFLLAWQKLAPEHQMEGPESVRAMIDLLEGVEAPAAAWEGELLPSRMVEYDPAWLDALCLSGEVVWARLTPPVRASSEVEKTRGSGPVRNTPIALLRRKNFAMWNSVFLESGAPIVKSEELSSVTQTVFQYLTSRGASFFSDIVENTKLLKSQVEDSLAELVANGVVVSDSFSGLRALLTPGSRKTVAAAKRKQRQPVYDMASAGRWSILQRTVVAEPAQLEAETVETVAWVLLRRYGVVFKRLLEREGVRVPWRVLLRTYHRLEARGEIRGGRFVAGISGEQFALPEAVGMLRAIRRAGVQESLISVSAADPMNLVGIITPGNRVTAHTGNRVLYQDGAPIATLESGETKFLVELSRAMEWKAKAAVMRKATRPELRSYLRRPA
jgi:ATP-dependent Lhr-like helicase